MNMNHPHSTITLIPTETSELAITPTPFQPKHFHGIPILERMGLTPSEKLYWESYNTTTFFTTDLGKPMALKWHTTTFITCVLIIYPLCLVFRRNNPIRYKFTLTINQVLFLISQISLWVYKSTFPNSEIWYPHNIYFRVFNILSATLLLYYIFYMILYFPSINIFNYDRNRHFLLNRFLSHNEQEQNEENNQETFEMDSHISTPTNNQIIDNLNFKSLNSLQGTSKIKQILHYYVEFWNVLLLFFMGVTLFIGLAIGNLFGKDKRIFNLLAHWIKGGVFLILGIVSLGRYCGNGETYGWAWNPVVLTRKDLKENCLWKGYTPRGTITMECIETGLILFYGCTNIFLEHLAGAGGAWTAKDLQHVSIAFMYLGTGLCGVLIEIQLNKWKFEKANQILIDNSSSQRDCTLNEDTEIVAGSPGYSPNPFPTFTIFWTGILMSQHAQASELSTKIHTQWGSLLAYGSFFRVLTYIIFYLQPPKDINLTRPITELITSFCLICGGIIFMESTDQVIEAMEYRGFTPLFSCNLCVGFSVLLMAWIMTLFMWKKSLNVRFKRLNNQT